MVYFLSHTGTLPCIVNLFINLINVFSAYFLYSFVHKDMFIFSNFSFLFNKNNCLEFVVRSLMKYAFCSFLRITKNVLFPLLSLFRENSLIIRSRRKVVTSYLNHFISLFHTPNSFFTIYH